MRPGSTWRQWLVDDQRAVSDRPDVLTYQTPPLEAPVTLAGAQVADLVASTTASDGDFVFKLIDLYPDEVPEKPEIGVISCSSRWTSCATAIDRPAHLPFNGFSASFVTASD